jgi:hypothetical protein
LADATWLQIETKAADLGITGKEFMRKSNAEILAALKGTYLQNIDIATIRALYDTMENTSTTAAGILGDKTESVRDRI